MTPEEKARRNIDRRLAACGWVVQDRDEMDITAGPGVAVREFPLDVGEADYLLYAGGRVIGIVEAKPEGHSLSGVESQSSKYVHALPAGVPSHRLPLPFHYESTGQITQFTNLMEPDAGRSTEQVIDEQTPDELLFAGADPKTLEKAQAVVTSFRRFIEDNRDELEAVRAFYSRPYRAGLRFKHLKELAEKLKSPPVSASPEQVWKAFAAVEPQAVKGPWGRLTDVIALVRHAVDPSAPIVPVSAEVRERYGAWLAAKAAEGVTFGDEQRKWLDAIADHIATSLRVEEDDFEYAPFNRLGGLGRAYEVFGGERLKALLDELNGGLAA